MGGAVLPPCCLAWGQTINPHLQQRLLQIHRQVWLSLLWGHCSFLLVHAGFICALQESVSPVLWKFRSETPLVFKVKFPGSSQSLLDPQVGNLLWALELSQQFENFLGIVVLQCVGHLLSGFMVGLMATSSKRTYATLSVLQEVYSYFHIHFVIWMGFVVEDVNTAALCFDLAE